MVNLLSKSAQRKLLNLYYVRFFTALALLLACGTFMSVALLIPSYFLATGQADGAKRYRAASEEAITLGPRGGVTGTLAVLTERIRILKTYPHAPVISPVLSALTAHTGKGITLSEIDITPGENSEGTISITGKADTRDELLAFVEALQGVSVFQKVSVPVSDLASQSNAAFTLSFSFSLPHS